MADVTTEENYRPRDQLVRSVSAYLRRDPAFYIGITSGSSRSGHAAMTSRRDNTYDARGLNRMIAIYRSRSQDVCRDIEEELVDEYADRPMCLNKRGGGGGGPTEQPWSFVYLCLAEE